MSARILKLENTLIVEEVRGGELIPLDVELQRAREADSEAGGIAGANNWLVTVLRGMLLEWGDSNKPSQHGMWAAALEAHRMYLGELTELYNDLIAAAVVHADPSPTGKADLIRAFGITPEGDANDQITRFLLNRFSGSRVAGLLMQMEHAHR